MSRLRQLKRIAGTKCEMPSSITPQFSPGSSYVLVSPGSPFRVAAAAQVARVHSSSRTHAGTRHRRGHCDVQRHLRHRAAAAAFPEIRTGSCMSKPTRRPTTSSPRHGRDTWTSASRTRPSNVSPASAVPAGVNLDTGSQVRAPAQHVHQRSLLRRVWREAALGTHLPSGRGAGRAQQRCGAELRSVAAEFWRQSQCCRHVGSY